MSVVWEPDSASPCCRLCGVKWTIFKYRRHHCRNCGKLVCYKCSTERLYLSIQEPKSVRVCDKCVEQIRSAEKPHLSKADQESDDGSVGALSVVSDGKCKATETPFRNTLSQNNTQVATNNLLEMEDADSDDGQPQGQWKTIPENELASPTDKPMDNTHAALTLDEVAELQQPNFEGAVGSALSPGMASMRSATSDTFETPAALLNLQEGVVHRPSREPSLNVNLSKYGTMAFTDDESSPPPSSEQHTPTPKAFDFDATAAETGKDTVDTEAAAAAAAAAESSRERVAGTPDSAQSTDAADSTAAGAVAAVDANTSATAVTETAKPKGPVKIVLKKRASTHTPTPDELHPGISPMPTGGTVRRLSTLAPRTPFNSAVTMSPAAAEIAQAQQAAQTAAALEAVGAQLTGAEEGATAAVAEAAVAEAAVEDAVATEGGAVTELTEDQGQGTDAVENAEHGAEVKTVPSDSTPAVADAPEAGEEASAVDATATTDQTETGDRQVSVASTGEAEKVRTESTASTGTGTGKKSGNRSGNKGGRGGRRGAR